MVGTWIKVRKKIVTDPRLIRMARHLGAREGYQGWPPELLLTTCLGAVIILWITADAHIDQNDVMAFGPADVEQFTGIKGICEILPPDWLQVLDADHVKLPGFQAHNGSEARRKALGKARQQRYRNRLASPKRLQ